MGIGDDARRRYERHETERVDRWVGDEAIALEMHTAVRRALGRDDDPEGVRVHSFRVPHETELNVDPVWQEAGVVARFSEADDLELYLDLDVRASDAPVAVAYVIGACRRCGAQTVLTPPCTELLDVGRALVRGQGVDPHRCRTA